LCGGTAVHVSSTRVPVLVCVCVCFPYTVIQVCFYQKKKKHIVGASRKSS
jgi:hypothetical protein